MIKMVDLAITGIPNGSGSLFNRIDYAGDADQFDIFLRGGELYQFQANNAGGAGGGLADPTLTLRNSAGVQLAFNDDRNGSLNRNSLIEFRTGTGFHSLTVAGYASNIGNYRLIASEVPGNVNTYSSLPAPALVNQTTRTTGDLHATGDQDYHRITLTAGQTYRFNLNGTNFGSGALADPFLELINGANNQVVAFDDDAGPGNNSQLTFTAQTSGTYFANARAFSDAYTGGYQLAATRIA